MNTAMTKPKFIFTKHTNSFSVNIENLEELSVEQIQNIQKFVEQRKGVFDFETYSFTIQKRLDFSEFAALLEHIGLDAYCEEKNLSFKTDVRIDFGQYKGMRYNELPDSYLLWLKANYKGKDSQVIEMELKSRSL
ncbi:putative quorum-sensing-regulated virulence factor [Sulfurimonas sp.]|uniref:putative quorum-sensing-regulated virulence factor n=1 Tax=Sulfurimonas sp. TaxID=2022749 RepID=UPI003D128423